MQKLSWQKYGFPRPKSEASKGSLSLVDNEIYSGIEIPTKPVFVRLDGWKFHGLCRKMKKPYDKFFASCLVRAAQEFFKIFNANLAYIFSDEINLLFLKRPGWARIEKIDSVFAGIASTAFTDAMRKKFPRMVPTIFDCRAIPMSRRADILRYLIWRQAESFRNHNNSWAYQKLREKGLSPPRAQKKLSGMNTAQLQKFMLEKLKFNLWETPTWQRNGILLYKEKYLKTGYDPIKKKKVKAERYKIITNWKPPIFKEQIGKSFLNNILKK